MADFIFSGGVRFDETCVADVTMDAEGKPLTCKNPITGDEISGDSDFTIATLTVTGAEGTKLTIDAASFTEEDGTVTSIGKVNAGETASVLLYKSKATAFITSEQTITVSGDITDEGDDTYTITGDCTAALS